MKQFKPLLLGAICALAASTAFSQGTAFLYQGQLVANGSPANGVYDLAFALFNASGQVGSALTYNSTSVNNGLFSVTLDYGPGVFNGANLWLQISVRTNGGGSFTALAPMQPILSAPYAVMAETANSLAGPLPAAQLTGVDSNTVTLENAANSFTGSFSGNGLSLANVNAALLNGLAGSSYATLGSLTNYATLGSLTNYATLGSLTNYATLGSLTNYATLASLTNYATLASLTSYATLDSLTNYATLASLSGSQSGSPIPTIQVFDSPGTTQFIVPANVTKIAVEVWGGGGGGGGSTAYNTHGSGGGAGGYGKAVFAVTPAASYTVVVGAGGGSASAGGASSFGALISAGGGSAGTNDQTSGPGGAGGASTAAINITGGAGQWTPGIYGGDGGSAGNGGSGGRGDNTSGAGDGQTPGGGGGGGEGNDPGGSGGGGRVIVYY